MQARDTSIEEEPSPSSPSFEGYDSIMRRVRAKVLGSLHPTRSAEEGPIVDVEDLSSHSSDNEDDGLGWESTSNSSAGTIV